MFADDDTTMNYMGIASRDTAVMTTAQEALLGQHAEDAIDALITRLNRHREQLVRLAMRRASSIGAAQYGNSSYEKTNEALDIDVDEELADAIFYQHIAVARWCGRL